MKRNPEVYKITLRARMEPLRPSGKFPSAPQGNSYLHKLNGHPVPWMCYCPERYEWLLGKLVKLKVDVSCFAKGEIPPMKCLEIAQALKKLKGQCEDKLGEELLATDIAFYRESGGVRLHDWKSFWSAY